MRIKGILIPTNGNLMNIIGREKCWKPNLNSISGDSGNRPDPIFILKASQNHLPDVIAAITHHNIWSDPCNYQEFSLSSLSSCPFDQPDNPGKTLSSTYPAFKSYKTFHYFNISAPDIFPSTLTLFGISSPSVWDSEVYRSHRPPIFKKSSQVSKPNSIFNFDIKLFIKYKTDWTLRVMICQVYYTPVEEVSGERVRK